MGMLISRRKISFEDFEEEEKEENVEVEEVPEWKKKKDNDKKYSQRGRPKKNLDILNY